jgi:hypothetical protein
MIYTSPIFPGSYRIQRLENRRHGPGAVQRVRKLVSSHGIDVADWVVDAGVTNMVI